MKFDISHISSNVIPAEFAVSSDLYNNPASHEPRVNSVVETLGNPKALTQLCLSLFVLTILVVGYMFHTKSYVQDLKFALRQLNSQIEHEQNQFNILKAELAYLNSPERLRKLASMYLDLEQIKPTQLVVSQKKTINHLSISKFTQFTSNNSRKRWHYKKGPSQILNTSTKKNNVSAVNIKN